MNEASQAGGFELNPWILSGQSQRKEHSDEPNKCQETNIKSNEQRW